MKLTKEIKQFIEKSVLCWLVTVSDDGIPNVSPKEVFDYYGDKIIIANIASPQSIKNIGDNERVCISFLDMLVQKGFQVKGKAVVKKKGDSGFGEMEKVLVKITEGKFPFASIIEITVDTVKPIIAPKYVLYPETTEQQQIESAKKSYGF